MEKVDNIETDQVNAMANQVVIPSMNELDEVVKFQQLFHDITQKELFCEIRLKTQHSITLCRVNYQDSRNVKIQVLSEQIVK